MDTIAAIWNDIVQWWQWLQANDYFTAALKYISGFTIGHKVLLLAFVLYVTLRIIGQVNGIKKTKYLDDMTPAPGQADLGTLRLPKARFDNSIISYYKDLSCTVNFWDPSRVPGWFRRLILRRKPPVSDEYTLAILADKGAFQSDYIGVDQHTRESLLTYIQDRDGPEKTLDTTKWKIELKKDNSLGFLLKHPDTTVRTTAWVILVTSIFSIVQSVLFEK